MPNVNQFPLWGFSYKPACDGMEVLVVEDVMSKSIV